MPKTFYDNDSNALGTFYTQAEVDALIGGGSTPHLYMHKINIDFDIYVNIIIYNNSNTAFTWSTLISYLTSNGFVDFRHCYPTSTIYNMDDNGIGSGVYADSINQYIEVVGVRTDSGNAYYFNESIVEGDVRFTDTITQIF